MIELADVHLTLPSTAGPVAILRGADLVVEAATSLSVVGPSGSGKSSLMSIIGGIERPSSGRVRVDGVELGSLDEDGLALFRRRRVGIVFQGFHLIPTMTARENVAIPLEFAGEADAFGRADKALTSVGLGHRLTHYPGQLSGGEQQRVALARALVIAPDLLLADEPTGNLDRVTGQQIIELMFDLTREHRTTLILITHDAELAARCARVVRMQDGRIAQDATSDLRVAQ